MFDKKSLSETDIRTKYITPAIVNAGWNPISQMREEYAVTKGRIIARGKTCKREAPLKADYVLFYKPNKPIAIISSMLHSNALHIFTRTSVLTFSFLPSFARAVVVIPVAVRNSVLFISLSIRSFHNFL